MYGWPPDFNPNIFLGKALGQIAISAGTLAFQLGEITVTLEIGLTVQLGDSPVSRFSLRMPAFDSRLLAFLEEPVVAASLNDLGLLELVFPAGVLTFLEAERYESIHVDGGIGFRFIV